MSRNIAVMIIINASSHSIEFSRFYYTSLISNIFLMLVNCFNRRPDFSLTYQIMRVVRLIPLNWDFSRRWHSVWRGAPLNYQYNVQTPANAV